MMELQRVHFLANVCHVCKSKNTPYTCEICKMIFYCSIDHRRENWLEHSELCWCLNKIAQAGNREQLWDSVNGKDFTSFRHDVASKCVRLLGRGLRPWEYEIIYHPRVCDVCHEFNWTKLQPCDKCHFIYTCKKRHFRKTHKKWCGILKVYSDICTSEIIKIQNKTEPLNFNIEAGQAMSEVFPTNFKTKSAVEKALATEVYTYPLTTLNSLKIINVLQKTHLTILFIGAEVQAEVNPLDKWECHFFHFLKSVFTLNLIFLGPELRQDSCEHTRDLCDGCRSEKKSLKFQFISGKFYHECCDDLKPKPDLICALNSGMYREFGFASENSWKETILKLFAHEGPPVLITEYTCRELRMDLEKIKNLCGKVKLIVQPKENPFASLKPGLNVFSGEEETPVIFKNYFYMILKK